MPRSFFSLAFGIAASLLPSSSAHPCESEHFEHCPEHGPKTVGECLAKVSPKSDDCSNWLTIHDACMAELTNECSASCAGEPCAYRDDAVGCLENLPASKRSERCIAALPLAEVKEEEEETEAMKKRRARKKAKRKKGIESVRKYHKREEKEKKEEKKKKAKQAKKEAKRKAKKKRNKKKKKKKGKSDL